MAVLRCVTLLLGLALLPMASAAAEEAAPQQALFSRTLPSDTDLKGLESTLSYTFTNRWLLRQALVHPSFGEWNNHRFSWLGDAIMTWVAHSTSTPVCHLVCCLLEACCTACAVWRVHRSVWAIWPQPPPVRLPLPRPPRTRYCCSAVVSDLLYKVLPEAATTERLHEERKKLVGRAGCADGAKDLGLDRLLVVGAGYLGKEPTVHMLAGGWAGPRSYTSTGSAPPPPAACCAMQQPLTLSTPTPIVQKPSRRCGARCMWTRDFHFSLSRRPMPGVFRSTSRMSTH